MNILYEQEEYQISNNNRNYYKYSKYYVQFISQ